MIKNIVFDFGNVIIKWDVDAIIRKYTNEEDELKQLKETIFESEEWGKLDKGLISLEQAIEIFENKLPSNLKSKAKEIMSSWFEKVEFNEKTCNLIKKLKSNGYKIYGLSNINIQFYEYIKKKEIGQYFDGFIISAVEKMMKPDKEIYYKLFEKFSLDPNECFFIDDLEKNIAASKECGMRGFVFDINQFQKLENELENII